MINQNQRIATPSCAATLVSSNTQVQLAFGFFEALVQVRANSRIRKADREVRFVLPQSIRLFSNRAKKLPRRTTRPSSGMSGTVSPARANTRTCV